MITAAASIMILVFASFALGDDRIIKLFGLGLASAVFFDAVIIRCLLVPALMEIFGTPRVVAARRGWTAGCRAWRSRRRTSAAPPHSPRQPPARPDSGSGASNALTSTRGTVGDQAATAQAGQTGFLVGELHKRREAGPGSTVMAGPSIGAGLPSSS